MLLDVTTIMVNAFARMNGMEESLVDVRKVSLESSYDNTGLSIYIRNV